MKGMFSDWTNLEAARDNASDSFEPWEGKLLLGKYVLTPKNLPKLTYGNVWYIYLRLFISASALNGLEGNRHAIKSICAACDI